MRGNACYDLGDEQGAFVDFNEAKHIEAAGAGEIYSEDEFAFYARGLARHRLGNREEVIEEMNGWVSPRLQIRFTLTPETLEIFSSTGQKFLSPVEIDQLREQERKRAERECQTKEAALQELERERDRYQELLAKLKEKGIDTDNL